MSATVVASSLFSGIILLCWPVLCQIDTCKEEGVSLEKATPPVMSVDKPMVHLTD